MLGTRLPDVRCDRPEGWDVWHRQDCGMEIIAAHGSYMRVIREDGSTWCWYLRAPTGDVCTIGWPDGCHSITEHDDGTITVSPSIVFPRGGYHGFLQRGVWS